jgi:hypothetical protein
VHPLATALTRAATGEFPVPDGGWQRIDPWRDGVEGVVAFTGHAYVAVGPDIDDRHLASLGVDGYGGANNPRLVAHLAGGGWIDALDTVLVARGTGGEPALVPRSDLRNHPRAELAASVRTGVRTFGYPAHDDHTLVTLATGLGGLAELGVETDPAHEPEGEVVVAACAPGNARAVRAFLGAGFEPVASVQLWRPERG